MTHTHAVSTARKSLVVLFCVVAFLPAYAQPPENSKHEPHLEALDWLTRGTWTAEAKMPNGKALIVQEDVRWAETGTAIYFLTRFNQQAHYYGVYLYDPAAKQIKFFYSANDGEMTAGHADPNANEIRQEFQVADNQGTTSFHSLIRRDGEDAYDFTVYQQGNDKPLVALRYVRK